MTKNLTTGSPIRAILSFGVPIILGFMFQRLYNMADSVIVSQFVGFEELGAVGSTGSLNFMVLGFVNGMCTGCSVNIAHAFGAGDMKKVKKYFANSIVLGLIVSVTLTTLTLVFLDDILHLMNTQEEIFMYSKVYIGTIFAGIIGTFLYSLLAAVLQALGDSRTPLIFLIGSSVLNIILSIVFIIYFQMGVFGAALGTVISQTSAGICCIVLIMKKFPLLRVGKDIFHPEFKVFAKLFNTGLPMGLQFSITAIGGVVMQSSVNNLGTTVVASVSSSSRIHIIFSQVLDGFGSAMASFAGQNTGANRFDRIRTGVKQTLIVGWVYSAFALTVLIFFGPLFATIFVSPDNTEAVEMMHLLLVMNSSAFFLLTPLNVCRNAIQGMGHTRVAMIAGVCEMFARIGASFLVGVWGVFGAGLSNPSAWSAAGIFLIITYFVIINQHDPKPKKHRKIAS